MNTLRLQLTFFVTSFFCTLGFSQQFIEATNANIITGITNAAVDWGDYDNDNDLDLIMIGNNGNSEYSRIYTNNLGSNYTNIVSPGVANGYTGAEANWGDYDNDNDLDFAMSGSISSCNYSPVVENRNIFLDNYSVRSFILPSLGLQGVQLGSVDWGDFDNDGDYDLVILGGSINLSERYTIIYENINDTMVIHTNLTGLGRGIAKWADVDNDHDLDLFVSGRGLVENEAYIYINNNGIFTNSVNSLVGVNYGDADFGDYDNDGDLDLILVGDSSTNAPIAILYNNNTGIFTPVVTDLIPIRKSTVRWGDYDNDGDLDLIAVGDTTHTTFGMDFLTSIYRNDGANVFVPIVHTIKGYKDANARWGDHDNDGDLDFILTGYSYVSPYNAGEIYQNQLSVDSTNTIPNTPDGLVSTVNNLDVDLDWNTASDNETPALGLNYNICVGNSPGGVEIESPMADLETGYRKKAEIGNTGSTSAWKLKNLPPGDYFWKVQSIDGAFAGSWFSPEEKFVIVDPNAPTLHYPYHQMTSVKIDTNLNWYSFPGALSYHVQLDTSANFTSPIIDEVSLTDTLNPFLLDFNKKYFWRVRATTATGTTDWSYIRSFTTIPRFSFEDYNLPGAAGGEVAFGDFDNDDDLDFALVGDGLNGTDFRKIYENVNSDFIDYNAALVQNNQGGCTWADFDKDNDLDLLITSAWNCETRLYENSAGTFLDNSGNIYSLGNVTRKTAWADYDNDGDLDFALLGIDVFRNNGGVFSPISAGFAYTTSGDLAWGDYDNDKDMDLMVTGSNGGSGFSMRLYRNNGNNTFTEIIGHGIQMQTHGARIRWGDLDEDGDLDVLASGQTYETPYRWSVYLNNGGLFTLHEQINDGINFGDIEWGDLDNDGDLDVIVSGANKTYIYFYTNQQYIREATLQGFSGSSIDLGDYDDDNDLDILISGAVNSYPITKLYKNNSLIKNTIPSPPTVLYSTNDNGTIVLSWNAGSDAETNATGLTYNFYLSTVPSSADFTTPMASLITGKRRIAAIGNANSNLEWVLENVPYGTYYWSVQSIDNNYDGSLFAPEQTITVSCESNTNDFITACGAHTWIDGNTYTSNNNIATWVLTNSGGCDSTVALKLNILNPTTGIDVHTECESYMWIDGNTYTSSNNSATHILTNAVGCDSTVTLDLTILNPTTRTDSHATCDSYTWIDGNTYTSSNNSATWVLTNAVGCDSTITLDLTITNSTNVTDVQSACISYTWIDGNTYTSSNNTANWYLTNAAGCDSVITLDLTISNPTSGTDVQSACISYTWIDGNTYTSSNNSATWMLTNSGGCDSTVTLDLTISNPTSGTDVLVECDSHTWIDGITYTSNNNTATWIIPNSGGCDSTVTLDLTITNSTSGTDVQTACESFQWIDGITYTSNNTTATWILTNATGCDSIVTLDLTVNNLDESISQLDEVTLQANASGLNYQWLDCELNYTAIPGEINQIFIGTQNGNYAVEVSSNGCKDTSTCILINKISVSESDLNNGLVYYPNPTMDGVINFEYDGKIESIVVYDMLGRIVNISVDLDKNRIEGTTLLPGTYIIRFNTDQGSLIREFTIVN